MKVVDNANSKELVRFALQSKGRLSIKKSEDKSIDFIVSPIEDINKKYGIVIRYRNIPEKETKSNVFDDLDKIKENCAKNNLIPTIAFVLYNKNSDNTKKYTYVFLFTIEELENLANSKHLENEISYVDHGIQIKYGTGQEVDTKMLEKLKEHLDYIEITVGEKDFAEYY